MLVTPVPQHLPASSSHRTAAFLKESSSQMPTFLQELVVWGVTVRMDSLGQGQLCSRLRRSAKDASGSEIRASECCCQKQRQR